MISLSMSENGRIVIPAAMRADLRIQSGERLYLEIRDGGIFMSTAAQRQTQRKAYFDRWLTAPASRVASEELIAERRLEASHDAALSGKPGKKKRAAQ
ncbi:MAG: AbrB/MazE/SpoVT family DNA-binding domain-containing protein [Cytophagales bacterium]|nr:AbrB/MazE/SpoVT family DNA-binding domain-containing protein [Cytophagales bacterium]